MIYCNSRLKDKLHKNEIEEKKQETKFPTFFHLKNFIKIRIRL